MTNIPIEYLDDDRWLADIRQNKWAAEGRQLRSQDDALQWLHPVISWLLILRGSCLTIY